MSSIKLKNSLTDNDDAMQMLAILCQCFGSIILGYVSGRLSIISESQSRGITNFVSYFSLPALIFISLAKCDLSQIDWYFVASVFITKVIVFVGVVIITILMTRPCNLGKAGLYGMLTTQSNDFAIGYPIFTSLYASSQPHFADYLYVIAPLQLLFINPCGLFLLELYKYRQSVANSSTGQSSKIIIIVKVLRNTLNNPIILMTIGGLVWNLSFGNSIPSIINGLLTSFSNAFSAVSLFLLGLNIVQESGLVGNSAKLVVPCTLGMVKLLISPLILRLITRYLVRGTDCYVTTMANFGFLYGAIPSAPTSVIFAIIYNLGSWVSSYAIIVSTIISAPLLFVSASMIRYTDYTEDQITHNLCLTIYTISIIAIPCATFTLISLMFGRKWTSITHRITIGLLITQLIVAIGGYLMPHDSMVIKFKYIIPLFGIFASRIWTSLLALTLCLPLKKSLYFILRIQKIFSVGAIILTIILTGLLYLVAPYSTESSIDPYFKFGTYQTFPTLAVTIVSILITGFSVIFQQRNKASTNMSGKFDSVIESSIDSGRETPAHEDIQESQPGGSRDSEIDNIKDLMNSTTSEESIKGIHYITIPKCIQKQVNNSQTETSNIPVERLTVSFNKYIQRTNHLALLLILLLSMIVDLAVCISKAFKEKFTGIHVELVLLDIFLTYGQAISTFILFGLDATPFIDIWRRLCFHYSIFQEDEKDDENISRESYQICQQFSTYHLEKCAKDICFYISRGKNETNVFKGCDLISWLFKSGLVSSRKSARNYASHLLFGQIIKSTINQPYFLDTSSFYQFIQTSNTKIM